MLIPIASRRMERRDAPLGILETAYQRWQESDGAWVDAVRRSLAALEVGEWSAYVVGDDTLEGFSGPFPFPTAQLAAAHRRVFVRGCGRALVPAAYAPAPPVERARARWRRIARVAGGDLGALEKRLGFGVPEMWGLLCGDERGRGPFFARLGRTPLAPRTSRVLADVAAHLASLARLRKALGGRRETLEAICAPDGRLLHGNAAAVAARTSLAAAVKAMERARGPLRRLDPDEAVATWRAMVEGRWTLVERTDTDGKRLLLAHRNDRPRALGALGRIEVAVAGLAALGHSDKYIGYELGIARSTVSTHLARALEKLHLPDRRALVAAHGPLTVAGTALRGALPPPRGLVVHVLELGSRELVQFEWDRTGAVRPPAVLTAAEQEVFDRVLRGCSNRSIAEERGRHPKTIAKQIASLCRKLGVGSRLELIARMGAPRG